MPTGVAFHNFGLPKQKATTLLRRQIAIKALKERSDIHPRELAELFPDDVGKRSPDPVKTREATAEKLLTELRQEGLAFRQDDGRFRRTRSLL